LFCICVQWKFHHQINLAWQATRWISSSLWRWRAMKIMVISVVHKKPHHKLTVTLLVTQQKSQEQHPSMRPWGRAQTHWRLQVGVQVNNSMSTSMQVPIMFIVREVENILEVIKSHLRMGKLMLCLFQWDLVPAA
jgi:hypothetical protein